MGGQRSPRWVVNVSQEIGCRAARSHRSEAWLTRKRSAMHDAILTESAQDAERISHIRWLGIFGPVQNRPTTEQPPKSRAHAWEIRGHCSRPPARTHCLPRGKPAMRHEEHLSQQWAGIGRSLHQARKAVLLRGASHLLGTGIERRGLMKSFMEASRTCHKSSSQRLPAGNIVGGVWSNSFGDKHW